MKKVLLVVCAVLLACSTVSMADLIGDDVRWDALFSDDSPYAGGERVRVSALVLNTNTWGQPIRLVWQMMDPLGNVASGTIQKTIPPGYARTLSFSRPLPVGAFPGLYTWSGVMYSKEPDLSWQALGEKAVTFTVGGEGSTAPAGNWEFFADLYPDTLAQGENFHQNAMVGNGTEVPTTVQVQSLITSPSGQEYLLGPHPILVDANSNSGLRFTVTPHIDAPGGAYTVLQQLLDLDGELLSEVATGFSISGANFSLVLGDALLALAAVPEENKLDPEYDVAADLDTILTLYNAGDAAGALAQAEAMVAYLPTMFTTAGDFAPALADVVEYLQASLNMSFTFSL